MTQVSSSRDLVGVQPNDVEPSRGTTLATIETVRCLDCGSRLLEAGGGGTISHEPGLPATAATWAGSRRRSRSAQRGGGRSDADRPRHPLRVIALTPPK